MKYFLIPGLIFCVATCQTKDCDPRPDVPAISIQLFEKDNGYYRKLFPQRVTENAFYPC